MSASNATSTSSSSLCSGSPNATSNGIDDIQYLLYLETLRRFRDDEANIKRQVDEKNRQYLEAKEEYLQLYSKFVKLTTLAATRCALLNDNHLPSSKIADTEKEITAIAHKLGSGDVIEVINTSEIEECKSKLGACTTHDNLKKLCKELAESKATVRAVQTSTETVEATIETATLQSLDYFVEEVGRKD